MQEIAFLRLRLWGFIQKMYENTPRIMGTELLRIILHEKSSGGKRAAEKTAMPYISAAFVLYFQVITDILGTKKLLFSFKILRGGF